MNQIILLFLSAGIPAFAIGLGVSWSDWWIVGFGCIWLALTTIRGNAKIFRENQIKLILTKDGVMKIIYKRSDFEFIVRSNPTKPIRIETKESGTRIFWEGNPESERGKEWLFSQSKRRK